MSQIATIEYDCLACLQDSFDPFSRRYRYAYNVCQDCAPGVKNLLPCTLCSQERLDETHQHYGFQGNSCYVCGPKITLVRSDSKPICLDTYTQLDEIDAVSTLLKRGSIVAIDALWGTYVACHFDDIAARQKVARYTKQNTPYTLLARDIDIIARYARVATADLKTLCLPERPWTVLVNKDDKSGTEMCHHWSLPFSPLLHLLLRNFPHPLFVIDYTRVTKQEIDLADFYLTHSGRNQHAVRRVQATYHPADDITSRVHHAELLGFERYQGHVYTTLLQHFHPMDENVVACIFDGALPNEGSFNGEFFLYDTNACSHAARFSRPISFLPEGEPWHAFYAHLMSSMGWAEYKMNFSELSITTFLESQPLSTINTTLQNAQTTSSYLLLFEALAFAVGLGKDKPLYGAEVIYALEKMCNQKTLDNVDDALIYPFAIPYIPGTKIPYIEPISVWRSILGDCVLQTPPPVMVARFYLGLHKVFITMIRQLCKIDDGGPNQINKIILSEGIFEHTLLLKLITKTLQEQGFEIIKPRKNVKKRRHSLAKHA